MDTASRRHLNAINRAFYDAVADAFDQTRGRPWPGWERLGPYLPSRPARYRVLDVGCGNGRFGRFLAERWPQTALLYHGVDNNSALLARAAATMAAFPSAQPQFTASDIMEAPLPQGSYDLVVLFGVMHHVAGAAQRRALMRDLAARVAAGGLLAFACWRFAEQARFMARVAPWPAGVARETGDYLLDWREGGHALRYCHYVDDAEHDALIAASGLQHLATYRADGATGDMNCYSVLARAAP